MADQEEQQAQQQSGDAAPQVSMRILSQYIRDLSFENIVAQKGIEGEVQPALTVSVNLDARKLKRENQYEVLMRLNVQSNDKESEKSLFVAELDYAGIFDVRGVPEDQLHPFLLIECPRMLFPFARRIISDVTRDGSFAPVNLENINFVALYRQGVAQRKKEEAEANQSDETVTQAQ